MEPRISIITLGVQDLARSLAFYREGLGMPTTSDLAKGVVFFQTRGVCLALYPFDKLAEDVWGDATPQVAPVRFGGIALAHNVRSQEEVDALLAQAEAAGGRIEKPAHDTFWGGYAGYFSDPDGYLWEIAFGAFEFNDDGSLKIP
jgi:hypothetical protein